MKLALLIPCFIERKAIEGILLRLGGRAHQPKEIIINDHSTDGTCEILKKPTSRF
jgi:hypothetical protein